MVSRYEPPQLDPSIWFTWSEDSGWTEDMTSWKIFIDSKGNLIQHVNRWSPKLHEQFVTKLVKEDLEELRRLIDEIDFERLIKLAPLGDVDDAGSSHLTIDKGDSVCDFNSCLWEMLNECLRRKKADELSSPPGQSNKVENSTDILTAIRCMLLLEWVISKCPFQECCWAEQSGWRQYLETGHVREDLIGKDFEFLFGEHTGDQENGEEIFDIPS